MANTFKFGAGEWYGKKDTILAFNDENKNYKPLAFTFSRDSTGTIVNKDGLIETVGIDEPRVDYLDNADGHLLLEPSRQNQAEYSVNLNSLLSSGTPAITANQTTAPDGTNTASKITQTNTNTYQSRFKQGFTVSGSTTYTRSIFAKAAEDDLLFLLQYDGSTNHGTYFDLTNGTKTDSNASISSNIEDFGDGWYRCSVTFTTNSSATFERIQVAIAQTVNATPTYQGDGTSGFYIWGAQFESGSYATSLIKTNGSSVTRAADSCNGAGNSEVFNDSEGTVFLNFAADFNISGSGLADRGISLSNGTNTNSARIFQATSLDNKIAYDLDTTAGTNQVFNTSTTFTDITDFNKVAFTYKVNEFKIFSNGSQQGSTDTSGSVFTAGTLNTLSFDYGTAGNKPFYGKIKEIKVYNTALTDAELITLTT